MKTKNLIERLSLFLLALVLTMPTWAQGGSGNESETITIASKADWKTFCDRVNSGQTTLNAKLTKDVDLGEEIVMAGTLNPYSSGYDFFYYTGTFDGQGHTLKFNWNAGEKNYIAPFWCVKDATIKNLRTQGKITTKGYGLSGMVRIALGTTTISGCISDVDITAGNSGWNDSKAAGMVQAVASGASVQITDCLVKGRITDTADEDYRMMAGFVFDNSGTYTLTRCLYVGTNNAANSKNSYTFGTEKGISATFTDCYYLNTCGKAQGKQVTAERLKSGEMAYLLQNKRPENVWGQTLGTDTIPQPTTDATKRVYEVKFVYNGEVKATRYATNGQSIHGGLPTAQDLLGTGYNPHHYYAIAFEGGFNASTPVNADRKVDITLAEKDCYEIASKADWKAFCALVNGGQNAIDAKMTADVDLGEDIMMLGHGKNYSGTFDGQNHTLKINWNSGDRPWIAPFQTVDGATIKNLRTEGVINSSTHFLSGLIYDAYGTTTISGCVSNVNIISSYTGQGCDAAGMIECVRQNAKATITDCIVKGKFHATTEKGKESMGGFVCSQYGKCTLTNCLYVGENNATGGYTFASDSDPKATTTLNNCYYLNTCGKAQGDKITEAQLRNGYVAYKLQKGRESQVWGQTLGTDNEPQLTADAAKKVCKVDFAYKNNVRATRYANSGKGIHGGLPTAEELLGTGYNPKMTYALNFVNFTANTPVTEDKSVDVTVTGTFDIASKEDWKAFCDLVNDGQNAVDAKMTADVDLGTEILMVGYDKRYSGTFDGQGHTLKFDWNAGEDNKIAPFRRVKDATIRNLRTQGKITTKSSGLSGMVYAALGTTTLTGCISDVDITGGSGRNASKAAGMLQTVAPYASVQITDCLVKGRITDNSDEDERAMAGFVLYKVGTYTLTRCLYVGKNNATNEHSKTFGTESGISATFTDCYYLNTCGKKQGTKITEEQLKSGEVTKKLQADRTDKCYWAQQLGEMPDFYNAADKSKANYVYYDAAKKGWACDDFRLTDEQPLPIGLDFTATKATYDRTLAAGKATLCLPYELPVQGFRAYTLADRQESRTAVHFKEVNGTLEAYSPYLLTADAPARLDGENLQVKADRSSIVLYSGEYAFSGAVQDVVNWWLASAHAYILQADGQFHKVTSDNPSVTVPAYRAYISYNSHEGAKPLSIVFDGETTGIDGTTDDATDGAADGAVYNLQGQRVADRLNDSVRRQIPAGVYIVNGRKVIVK